MKARYYKNWKYGMHADIELLLANKLYLKHRSELFKKHRNGWWYYWENRQSRKSKEFGHEQFMRAIITDYDE